MPYPEDYVNTDPNKNTEFKHGQFIKTETTFAQVYAMDMALKYSADKTTNDIYESSVTKKLLLNAVDEQGNVMVSYDTIAKHVESDMKALFGKEYYDREVYLHQILVNGKTVVLGNSDINVGEGKIGPFLLKLAPLVFNYPNVIVVDMNLNTITVDEDLPTDKWDFSVKSYGEYIWGKYNLEDATTSVNAYPSIFHKNSAILFTERNPAFNFKTVAPYTVPADPSAPEGTTDEHYASEVNCGNVDPVSLKNVLRKVKLYNPADKQAKDDGDADVVAEGFEDLSIEPAYLFNRVTTEVDKENNAYCVGTSINNLGNAENLFADTTNPAKFLLKKFASGGLFTKFNRFALVNIVTPENESSPENVFKAKINEIFAGLTTGFDESNELKTVDLLESKLFKLYNEYGMLEDALDRGLQNPVDGTSNEVNYDLDQFTIRFLVKLQGTINVQANENYTNANTLEENLAAAQADLAAANADLAAAQNAIDLLEVELAGASVDDDTTAINQAHDEAIEDADRATEAIEDANQAVQEAHEAIEAAAQAAAQAVDNSSANKQLQEVINNFFPNSNVYVHKMNDPSQLATIKYETVIKFEAINKPCPDGDDGYDGDDGDDTNQNGPNEGLLGPWENVDQESRAHSLAISLHAVNSTGPTDDAPDQFLTAQIGLASSVNMLQTIGVSVPTGTDPVDYYNHLIDVIATNGGVAWVLTRLSENPDGVVNSAAWDNLSPTQKSHAYSVAQKCVVDAEQLAVDDPSRDPTAYLLNVNNAYSEAEVNAVLDAAGLASSIDTGLDLEPAKYFWNTMTDIIMSNGSVYGFKHIYQTFVA